MSQIPDRNLDNVFSALADPTRRSILKKLQATEQSLLDLAQEYEVSFQAVSKHLRTLEKAGLVKSRKSGRNRYFQTDPQGLTNAIQWITQSDPLWKQTLDQLRALLGRK